MSAPTPAPGDERPREGYYPDPSIPGYVRYWNGAAWVPGTSRPAPSGGEPSAAPPGPRPATPGPPAAPATPATLEETGPHFFDEDPQPPAEPARPASADALHGNRPEPASAWGADRSRQSGFGAPDRRVSWGTPKAADPRLPAAPAPPGTPAAQAPPGGTDGARTASTDGTATIPPADDGSPQGTVVFRRPGTSGHAPAAGSGVAGGGVAGSGTAEGTRPPVTDARAAAQQALGLGAPGTAADPAPGAAPSGPLTAPQPPAPRGPAAQAVPATPAAPAGPQTAPADLRKPDVPHQQSAVSPFTARPVSGAPASGTPGAPVQATSPSSSSATTPLAPGSGGGQPSWAQQVHQLAGGEEAPPVAPWKPVTEDPFQAAARRRAAARPAGLGKRLGARLVDTLVVGAVTGAAAVPFGIRAADHIDAKITAARQSGETVTVWLLDGTTSVYLATVLVVLLAFGVLYEALPTARWGRTLGKKLFGLEVRDIEGHEPPSFGRALLRWLVYSVPGLLVIGAVGVLWCLFDKPWRQCWHDKAAHTFVAG